jgi:cytochrome c peroxidase
MRKLIGLCVLFFSMLVNAESTLGTPDRDDIEYPDDEAPSKQEVELGKILFFDNRLSINDQQSCATCHNPDLGFGDAVAAGSGTMGGSLGRNTPHIYNLAWGSIFMWDGRKPSLESQALGPIEAAGEMNMPLNVLLPKLNAVPFYQQQFEAVYGSSIVTKENLGKALAAFERTIISDNSAFDKYIAGNKNAMSPAAVRGLALFETKANCVKCHDGVNFTDDSFHNIGIKGNDQGRDVIVSSPGMKGAFKTPGLRNTLLTSPYMHDGSLASLEEVIRFYNRGGDDEQGRSKLIEPLKLNELEIQQLVAFLGALTDPVVIERPSIP